MKINFQKITKTALILVYIVIVAGALVRMTGSGMGCPDWPRCFGYYIPPTDIKELQFSSNHEFKRGQVIIQDNKLHVARETFTTGAVYNEADWENYTKHDYAEFNPVHTWVEYLNRLAGALAGLAVLVMAGGSLVYSNRKTSIIFLSWLTVFLMGFQAWLGATVVYSVLNPVKITVHMVVALLIVAVILYILDRSKDLSQSLKVYKHDVLFKRMLWFSIILTLTQIVMGTQVRQFVDEQIKMLGHENIALVMDKPTVNFYIHRSFSIIVLFANVVLFNRNKKFALGFNKISWVLVLLLVEIASGIAMYNFDFPFASQTIHIVVASLLFGIQFYMILESRRSAAVNISKA